MYRRADQIKVVDRIDYLPVAVSAADIESLYIGDLGSLMLESVDVADIEGAYLSDLEYVPDMILEAIKAKASKLNQRMKAFSRALGQQLAPIGMTAGDVEISKPRKSGAVAVQVAKIPLSDGQSVSLVFHAPDNDPLKIEADDTLIAFRFLVNSRDVTHIVAPSGGRDISLKQTALALANVVEKNAPKFAQAQAKKTEQAAELEQVKEQIDAAEADISNLGVEYETYQELKQSREKKARTLQNQIDNQNEIQAELRKQIEVKQAAKENAAGNEDKLKALFGTPKLKAASDVVMSDGHARIFQDLATIADIDINGQSFDDRSAYVSSIVGRVKRLSKNGEQNKVDNILTMLNEYNKVADKPAITLRNGIWKLGEPKSISVPEEPQPESQAVTNDDLKNLGDSVVIGDGTFIIDAIFTDSQKVRFFDHETQEKFEMTGLALQEKGIFVKGIHSEDLASGVDPLVVELKPIIQGLPTNDWFTPKGKMTFTGFDAIYDALIAKGYNADDARIKSRQVMDRHNMEELDYFTNFTDGQKPEDQDQGQRTDEVMAQDLAALEGLYTTGFSKKGKSKTMVSMRVLTGVTPAGTHGAGLNGGVYVNQRSVEVIAGKSTYYAYIMSNIKADEPRYIVSTDNGSGKADTPEEAFAELARIDGYVEREKPEEPPVSPEPMPEPEPAPNAGNSAAEMVRTVLSELESGAIALKQAKDRIRTNGEIPESLQGMVKSTIATMRKPRFLEEGKLLLKALEQYDENAPVVNVDGSTYSLNDFTYNIMDELGRFGDNLAAIAKDYPNKAIDYLDSDLDGLPQAAIDALKKAINDHYVAGGAGGEPVELNVDDLTDEEKAQLSFIQTFMDFKLILGEQEVAFPSGKSKTYSIEEPEDSSWQVDEVYDDLKDDLNLFGNSQLEPMAKQENNNYYNQDGQQVGIRTWHINSDYEKEASGAYSSSYLSAGTQGSEHHSYKVTPVTRDGKFTFAVIGNDGEIGLIDNFSELESLLVERHGLTTERPEQPVEPTQEEKHVEKLQEIRDYTGEPSLEKADEYQAAIESAYAFFEELSVLEEHNDLLEAAFANHVKLQSELTV